MMLLQNVTIITYNMRINILESGDVLDTKLRTKCILGNRYTDTNEIVRSEGFKDNFLPEVCQYGSGSNDDVRYIETRIFFENGLKLRQDLKVHR